MDWTFGQKLVELTKELSVNLFLPINFPLQAEVFTAVSLIFNAALALLS